VEGVHGGLLGTFREDFLEDCFCVRRDSCCGVSKYGFVLVSVEMILMFLRSEY